VKAKYLRNKTVANVWSINDSPCFEVLLKVKETYLAGIHVVMGNGNLCRIWKDQINGGNSFV
jgi:hypothetical protein